MKHAQLKHERLAADDVLDELERRGTIAAGTLREVCGMAIEMLAVGVASKYGAQNAVRDLGLGLGVRMARLVQKGSK